MIIAWFLIPAMLAMAVSLSLWTAFRLILWARRPQNIAGAFLLSAMAVTLTGYLFQLLNENPQVMLGWEKVLVIGLNLVYPAWLLFILYFTGNAKRVTPWLVSLLTLLSAFPIVTYCLPATSTWFQQTETVISIATLHVLKQPLGWAVWVTAINAQVEGIIGCIYLIQNLRRVRPGYPPAYHQFVPFTGTCFRGHLDGGFRGQPNCADIHFSPFFCPYQFCG